MSLSSVVSSKYLVVSPGNVFDQELHPTSSHSHWWDPFLLVCIFITCRAVAFPEMFLDHYLYFTYTLVGSRRDNHFCHSGSVCFWTYRIRIRHYFVRIRILPSTGQKIYFCWSWNLVSHWRKKQDPEADPDQLVSVTDPRIRIRIKMSSIHNTADNSWDGSVAVDVWQWKRSTLWTWLD